MGNKSQKNDRFLKADRYLKYKTQKYKIYYLFINQLPDTPLK